MPTRGPSHPTAGQVSEFIENIQGQFLNMLMFLAPFMDVSASRFLVRMDFGLAYSRTSTMEANPIDLPGRLDPHLLPSAIWIFQQLSTNVSDLLTSVKLLFRSLTQDIRGCIGTLNIDIRVGTHHHTQASMRVLPQMPDSPVLTMDPVSNDVDVNTNVESHSHSGNVGSDEVITFEPIPRGFNYFAQFRGQ